MSKVIKSLSVKIQSPRVVQSNKPFDCLDSAGFADISVFDPGNDMAEQDISELKDQAGEILAETEQMVKELLETAREEAEKIIRSANEEARRVVAEGRENLKKIEDEAYHKGWQEGYTEAALKAEKECEERLLEARNTVDKAREERCQIIAGSEEEIIQLSMAVARKIIDHELAASPEIVVEMVKRAIQKATDREELTVRVNPEGLDATINARDDISQSVKGIRKLKVLADPAIAPGGCVVESPNGTVDARVERQLSEIEQVLTEVNPNV